MKDPFALAVEAVQRGEIVAAATESTFGLLVDAFSEPAVARLFGVKGRAPTEPVPVLVRDASDLALLVDEIPRSARPLMERFWPGPLTLVFRARESVPELVCGGSGKVGIRVPGPCPAATLVQLSDRPLTATSANRSGQPPVTRDEDVRCALGETGGNIAVVVPGHARGGLPSTVVDVTVTPHRVLRQGAVRLSEGA